jgi:hypothetical protein
VNQARLVLGGIATIIEAAQNRPDCVSEGLIDRIHLIADAAYENKVDGKGFFAHAFDNPNIDSVEDYIFDSYFEERGMKRTKERAVKRPRKSPEPIPGELLQDWSQVDL